MKDKTKFTKKEIIVVLGCAVFLLLNFGAVGYRGRERAKIIVCQTNLKKIGQAQFLYLDDNDDRYPSAWNSIISTEVPVGGYNRFCRWHDPRFPAAGPLFSPYIAEEKIILCPTFIALGILFGQDHPLHNPNIPVVPYYSYSMNAFLGTQNFGIKSGVLKHSEITRDKSEVFFFAEENCWLREGCDTALNDTALCPDGRDWFGTFHNAPLTDPNAGTINAVFVDGHVQEVRSALKENPNDTSEMEFSQFEKYGWPFREPYR